MPCLRLLIPIDKGHRWCPLIFRESTATECGCKIFGGGRRGDSWFFGLKLTCLKVFGIRLPIAPGPGNAVAEELTHGNAQSRTACLRCIHQNEFNAASGVQDSRWGSSLLLINTNELPRLLPQYKGKGDTGLDRHPPTQLSVTSSQVMQFRSSGYQIRS